MNESSTPPPTTYRVAARTTGNGRSRVDIGTESVTLDTAWAEPAAGLPGPAELLTAAFAACLLHRNLRRYGTVYNTLAAVADVDGRVIAQGR